MKEKNEIRKVLILRLARLEPIGELVRGAAAEMFPKAAEIDFASQKSVGREQIRRGTGIKAGRIFPLADGVFSLKTLPAGLLAAIAREKYDLIIIPVNDLNWDGYFEVYAFALLCRPKNILVGHAMYCPPDGFTPRRRLFAPAELLRFVFGEAAYEAELELMKNIVTPMVTGVLSNAGRILGKAGHTRYRGRAN